MRDFGVKTNPFYMQNLLSELETLQELEVQQPLTTEQTERIEELYFILAI